MSRMWPRRTRRAWRGGPHDLESRLVWVFGSPRSGSTWLANLLGASDRAVVIDEPTIGAHLGLSVAAHLSMRTHAVPVGSQRVADVMRGHPDYLFSERYAAAWRGPLRDLVLSRLHAQVAETCDRLSIADPVVIVKEPHGSHAADLLRALVPRSWLLFLLRDGRDVLDSEVDGASTGSWAADVIDGLVTADLDRAGFLRDRAHLWVLRTTVVQRAYEAHDPQRRRRVRYEELVADTSAQLARLDDWLGLRLGERLPDIVEQGRADRQPDAVRGPGKFVRSATPGGWRHGLTAQEQAMADEVMGPTLRALGYA